MSLSKHTNSSSSPAPSQSESAKSDSVFKTGLTLEDVSRQIEQRRNAQNRSKTIQEELIDSALVQSQLLKICALCVGIGAFVGALFSESALFIRWLSSLV
jgi:hypothetical protein